MAGHDFDAFARVFALQGPRRWLFRTGVGGALAALGGLLHRHPAAAAACVLVGDPCRDAGQCCAGGRCAGGTCRCREGLTNCGRLCRDLETDPDHCGACRATCAGSRRCCAEGRCRRACGDECCADCFGETYDPSAPPDPRTHACCDEALVCRGRSADPADDVCCYPDERCVRDGCCCDGCLGTSVCGERCCPSASCCDGICCGRGEVCARRSRTALPTCVRADRRCGGNADCLVDETCVGGVCCAGDRICSGVDDRGNTVPVCCPYGKYCDRNAGWGFETCCSVGIGCISTARPIRIRV